MVLPGPPLDTPSFRLCRPIYALAPAITLQATMKDVIRKVSSEVYEQELEAFLFGHPAQVALLGLQFQWTADVQVRWASCKGNEVPAAS